MLCGPRLLPAVTSSLDDISSLRFSPQRWTRVPHCLEGEMARVTVTYRRSGLKVKNFKLSAWPRSFCLRLLGALPLWLHEVSDR